MYCSEGAGLSQAKPLKANDEWGVGPPGYLGTFYHPLLNPLDGRTGHTVFLSQDAQ
jgi:hypothetical protein